MVRIRGRRSRRNRRRRTKNTVGMVRRRRRRRRRRERRRDRGRGVDGSELASGDAELGDVHFHPLEGNGGGRGDAAEGVEGEDGGGDAVDDAVDEDAEHLHGALLHLLIDEADELGLIAEGIVGGGGGRGIAQPEGVRGGGGV